MADISNNFLYAKLDTNSNSNVDKTEAQSSSKFKNVETLSAKGDSVFNQLVQAETQKLEEAQQKTFSEKINGKQGEIVANLKTSVGALLDKISINYQAVSKDGLTEEAISSKQSELDQNIDAQIESEMNSIEQKVSDFVNKQATDVIKQYQTELEKNKTTQYNTEPGDTWYGMVQAKYGITDDSQIKEIVSQLKATAGVSKDDLELPSSINFPSIITLKDGTEIKLGDINATADKIHFNEKTEPTEEVTNTKPDLMAERKPKINELRANYDKALESYNRNKENDGIAEKIANGVSAALWNSKNTYKKVSADLDKFSATLGTLESLSQKESPTEEDINQIDTLISEL